MQDKIKQRKVLEADKVDQSSKQSVKDDAGDAGMKSRRTKSQRKGGALPVGAAAISDEQEDRVGDGELVREEARYVVDLGQLLGHLGHLLGHLGHLLGQLLLPPFLLLLIHLTGLTFTTFLLICAVTIFCLLEYIS